MTPTSNADVSLREILKVLRTHRRLWLLPALLGAVAAGGYSLLAPPSWQATQTLLVRDEAGGIAHAQGRFTSSDAMKTAQETIVQVAQNRSVLQAALKQVGPPPSRTGHPDWPTQDDLDHLQQDTRVTAPKGAELGRTEVLHLSVLAPTQDRAVQLASAVGDQLELRLKQLRDLKARSMIGELQRSVVVAQADTDAATGELESIEREVGRDLGELRILNDSGAGDSNLRASLNQIKNELRQLQTAHDANRQLHRLLLAAQKDTQQLVATPNRLLESQPGLRRLKDGLVDAQLRTAQLLGTMSAEHPEVQAARSAEQAVRDHLHEELELSVRGLDADLEVNRAQIASLETQASQVETRLERLAGLRAGYGNLVAKVQSCQETLRLAQHELADAKASQAAAQSSSLVSRLDTPVTGNRPLGPTTPMVILLGALAGFALGLGLIFLSTSQEPLRAYGRRWGDYLRGGRRASDRQAPNPNDRRGNRPAPDPDDRRAGDRRGTGRSTETLVPPEINVAEALNQLVEASSKD